MKKTTLLLISIGLISCSVEELNTTVSPDKAYDQYAVSMNEALDIASSFVSEKSLISKTKGSEPSVKFAFSIKDKTNRPFLHVINYDGGGYAVISGDMRIMPIQAYSSNESFDENQESYPLGLKLWLKATEAVRDSLIRKGVEPKQEVQSAWMHYKSSYYNPRQGLTKSLDPISMPEEEVDTLVGPLITDSWHQNSPYNDLLIPCPHYQYAGPNNYVYVGVVSPVVGCVPLSIARLLRYHQKPNYYSWASMPDHTPQTSQTKIYINTVHYAVKNYADSLNCLFVYLYDNGIVSTGVEMDFPIDSFIREKYGYSSALTETYSFSDHYKIRRDMFDYQLPCILWGFNSDGDGHCWVCDGYRYHCRPVYNMEGEFIYGVETCYLHHRWGMSGRLYDGWFAIDDVSMGNVTLDEDMLLVHRISWIDYWNSII